jgi:hypothetical protein
MPSYTKYAIYHHTFSMVWVHFTDKNFTDGRPISPTKNFTDRKFHRRRISPTENFTDEIFHGPKISPTTNFTDNENFSRRVIPCQVHQGLTPTVWDWLVFIFFNFFWSFIIHVSSYQKNSGCS